eukprot:2509686-Prymnesium_polylepis.1
MKSHDCTRLSGSTIRLCAFASLSPRGTRLCVFTPPTVLRFGVSTHLFSLEAKSESGCAADTQQVDAF